jgi:prolyl 4-hydroxylase
MDQDQGKPPTEWRTSTTYFLPSEGHPIVQDIDKRVANLTRTRTNQQEFVQVLRYLNGQKYDQHHDYFNKRFYQKDPHTLQMIENGEKNRFITVLWYLTSVSIGGHTIFPLFGGKRLQAGHDFTGCDDPNALKVAPEKGKVVIFYSLFADGELDETSLHGACPNGPEEVKWAGYNHHHFHYYAYYYNFYYY